MCIRDRATLVDAFDAERTRIERDLHDGAQRELVALTMALGVTHLHAQSLDERGRTGELRASLLTDLDAAQDRAEEALRALRETVRAEVVGLLADDLELVPAALGTTAPIVGAAHQARLRLLSRRAAGL